MKEESTSDAITHQLEECRMLIPGIQELDCFIFLSSLDLKRSENVAGGLF